MISFFDVLITVVFLLMLAAPGFFSLKRKCFLGRQATLYQISFVYKMGFSDLVNAKKTEFRERFE